MANLLKQYFKNEISLTMTLTENIKTTITNDNGMVKMINSVNYLPLGTLLYEISPVRIIPFQNDY